LEVILKNKEISLKEFAQRTGRRIDGVYVDLWSGRIPGKKKDGRWLISESAVQQFKRQDRKGKAKI